MVGTLQRPQSATYGIILIQSKASAMNPAKVLIVLVAAHCLSVPELSFTRMELFHVVEIMSRDNSRRML